VSPAGGLYEQHITGDISLAVRQLWYASADRAWLRDVGFPLANGSASFYAARVTRRAASSAGEEAFGIDGVMGPDEYAYPGERAPARTANAPLSL
jgi:trehalose/maltose hydrolase-like predicted phosphorylase